jgi:pimeloyl-ACP methyl ester carboxylesterase
MVAARLAPHFAVVCPDLRGYGQSIRGVLRQCVRTRPDKHDDLHPMKDCELAWAAPQSLTLEGGPTTTT